MSEYFIKFSNLVTVIFVLFYSNTLFAQPRIINGVSVPSDFPELIVTTNNNPSPGKIFIGNTSGNSYYVMIFENDGTPYYYKKVDHYSTDFKVQPNGMLSRYSPDDGGFITINNNFETTAVYKVQDYGTDEHDFFITPEGTFLIIGISAENRDMSSVVPGGQVNANLIGNVIQEIDTGYNVLFEWKASEYFDVTDAINEDLTSSRIDWVHMNSIALDYDGHILASSRHLSECTKINRQTGEIIWRLGGNKNEFTFINENLEFSYQHAFYPVEGQPGHYTIYDNGNHREQFTRVVEYKIDPINLTAENVWEFRYDPDLYTSRAGNAQRLPNGNTLINFEQPNNPKVVEVTPDGEIVYEANLSPQVEAHKTFRFEWEGMMNAPYLLSEPLTGSVRLLFNKFGDSNVVGYKIYGGPDSGNLSLITESNVTWADVDLRPYAEHEKYFFRVTSVSNQGSESSYSNLVEVRLTNLFSGLSTGILGSTIQDDENDPQWRDSQSGFGYALFFDGLDDYVNCANDNSLQITGYQITLEAWVNPVAFKANPYDGVIIGKDSFLQENHVGYSLSCGANGTVYFSIGNNTLHEVTTNTGVLTANQWHHVAAVFNGISLRIFVDGNLAAENTNVNTTIGNASSNNLKIGSSPFYSNRHFSGLIDEVRAWNVARSQEEIQAFMNNQVGAEIYTDATNGLVGYWQFNEGSGETTDDIALDNNLILNGDFSNNDNYWELNNANDANSAGSINDEGKYFADITNGGSFFQDIQLIQNNIWLVKDNSYTLSFDAWVNEPKIIYLRIRKSSTPFTDYSRIGAVYIQPGVSNYQFHFTMNENSDNSAELIFSIGGNETDFYLDNVRLTSDITSNKFDDFVITTDYKLIGNYPNPFNPSTTIEYHLPELSNVTISVYNVLGQLVHTLFDDMQSGGNHKIRFNGINLSSGVYFYTIEAKSTLTNKKFFDAKKMILIK